MAHQGSGTNLLRAFLNSHPDIYFYNELFCSVNPEHSWETWLPHLSTREEFLNLKFKQKEDYKAVGFDLKYNHRHQEVLDYIAKEKPLIIHLIRDSGRAFLQTVKKETGKFDYDNLMYYKEAIRKHRNSIDKFITNNGLKCFEFEYERMTLGREIDSIPEDLERELLNFLGVEYRKLSIDIKKDKITKPLVIRF